MDKETRRNVGRLIAGVVAADYQLDEVEDAFLDRLLTRFGIPATERHTLAAVLDRNEAAATMRRLPKDAQQEALTLLIEAALADGSVAEEEREYLHAIGEELGIATAEIDRRLAAKIG